MTWASLSPTQKMGIVIAIIVVILILVWGWMTDWHWRCWQRLPATGQTWT